MQDINKRLDRVDERLYAIEERLGMLPPRKGHADTPTEPVDDTDVQAEFLTAGVDRQKQDLQPGAEATATGSGPPDLEAALGRVARRSSTSSLMAIGASASFLLAAAYFVVLAIDSGWLTPGRQLVIAVAFGLGLIGAGMGLAERDRLYAAYLPAAGIGVLYLTVYTGHLYYGLISTLMAFISIAGVSLLAITLGRRFDNSVYTVLAVVGVYLTPLLVQIEQADLISIVVYFTAWSLLFSFLALQEGRRLPYLVALYMALLCFDAAWRLAGANDWALAASYQLVQFLVFVVTAVAFSVQHQRAMDEIEALFHGLPLFYFYLLEYVMLAQHAPGLVVVAGLASVVVVVGAFLLARRRIDDPDSMRAAAALVSSYAAAVTAHMVFGELLPVDYFAWGALLLPALSLAISRHFGWSRAVTLPIALIGGILMLSGFIQAILFDDGSQAPPAANALLLAYAAALYAAYFTVRHDEKPHGFGPIALYLGHLAVMVVTVRWIDSGLLISLGWAVYAVALLMLALKLNDRHVGQSSLFIFIASALKVLLFDLAGSGSTVRIGSLVILGASLYAGGWLYQNLVKHLDSRRDAGIDGAPD